MRRSPLTFLLVSALSAAGADAQEGGDDGRRDQRVQARAEQASEQAQVPPPPAAPRPDGGSRVNPQPKRQVKVPAQPGTRLMVAPGAQYRASGLSTMLLGKHYRRTWATPVQVEVLDLRSFGGGLTPVKKGGGLQTLSLTFQGRDGREYKFRTIDKDPTPTLEPKLRGTVAERIVRDSISAAHPGATLVVDALSEAAGLPHVKHRMVVLPDDDALGEFRKQFAGQLGLIAEVPRDEGPAAPGFEGVRKILDSEDLIELMEGDPRERIDTRSFVKARVFDMVIGDWDRHQDQWEWLQREGSPLWQPFPKDRDFAFSHFDGLLPGIMSGTHPALVRFGHRYPRILGLAWNSRVIDRRLLGGVEKPVYLEAAREVQASLTDAVIDRAVRQLPPEWHRLDGQRLSGILKARRDRLADAAAALYSLLAREVELHGTNEAETVEVRREEDDSLLVAMRAAGLDEPYLQRRFHDGETNEVRLYLKGGDDRTASFGRRGGDIKVRVAGGPGDDAVDDSQGGRTALFDHEGDNRLVEGPGSRENDNYWVQPAEPNADDRTYPMRDWGATTSFGPWLTAGYDLGVVMGARWQRKDYGFRKLPYASLQTLRVGYSTGRAGWRADYTTDFLHTNSHRRHRLRARVSDIEMVRFYGFGNETLTAGLPSDFFRTEQRQYLLSPSYRLGLRTLGIWLGAVGKFQQTKLAGGRFLDRERPYGVEDFGQVGPQLGLLIDTRDNEASARRGLLFSASGVYYPQVWSVKEPFTVASGELATYLTPVKPVTLALRAAGKKVWGDRIPFHEAAFIGGPETVRGLRRHRYAGDASALGNAELRIRLFEVTLVAPVEVGIFGFGDIGRVWVEGQPRSKVWHTGVGGGLSFAILRPENTITLMVAWPGAFREDGRFFQAFDQDTQPRYYLQSGFAF